MVSRPLLLFVTVLLVPAVLVGVWAVLQFGGSIERLAQEELRRAEEATAVFEEEFWNRVTGIPVGTEPSWREANQELSGAMRIGVELERQGDAAQALPYLERPPTPLPAVVLLAKARALIAVGRRADALAALAQEVPGDVGVGGIPVRLTQAILRAKAGGSEVVSEVYGQVLGGETYVPPDLATEVVASLAACAPPPNPVDVADFLHVAEGRRQLAARPIDRSAEIVWLTSHVMLAPSRDVLVPDSEYDEAFRAAADLIRSRFGLAAGSRPADPRVVRPQRLAAISDIRLVPLATRGSTRLLQVANWCLGLALVAFLAGNLLLYLVGRRTAALSRLRADFIDVVSHELRTPLTALSVRAEMLARGDVPAEKIADYQRTLHGDVQRLSSMVHDVLDFGRLERGRFRLRQQTVPLRRLVAHAVRASRDALRLGGQKLLVDAPRQLPELFVDVEVMTRALRNLIDNATKHAPAGSSIELRIAELTSGVELAVRDEGPGLRGADPRQLFEPFRKGDDAGRVQGSGLGLAIVDRAVRAHGGRVHARDRDGGGAEFRIVLPRSTEVR